jgi:hypothetical protein
MYGHVQHPLQAFLKFRHVPPALADKVRTYCRHVTQREVASDETAILQVSSGRPGREGACSRRVFHAPTKTTMEHHPQLGVVRSHVVAVMLPPVYPTSPLLGLLDAVIYVLH